MGRDLGRDRGKSVSLIVMQGIPGSGKSTRAKEIAGSVIKPIRLNRDVLREMLHFGAWTKQNELQTIEAEKALAHTFLMMGHTVIIDDTNLNQKALDIWQKVADTWKVPIQYCFMDTPLEECIERDRLRDRSVGETVIRRFSEQVKYGIQTPEAA